MILVDKKEFNYNEVDYLVDVEKTLHYTNGKDYYEYTTTIYSTNITEVKKYRGWWFNKKEYIEYKYTELCKYTTDWLNYFNYNGNIDKVINEAFKKYEWNLREQKYINEKENAWKEK